MGRKIKLKADDGFEFGAYRADPAGTPRGRVVVIQEIFGVNNHIRSVCDRLADAGYTALAPQIFDRLTPNFETGYSPEEIAVAREYISKVDWPKLMLDTKAALDELGREGPVAILGFCLGGSVAYMAATKFGGLAASICYYGGQIIQHIDKKPRCAVQMHFGELDTHIPQSDVQTMRQKQPEAKIYVYNGAGHGFHCDERGSFEPKSAKAAWGRSLAFLEAAFDTTAALMDAPTVRKPATPIAKQAAASKRKKLAAKKTKAKSKKKAKAKKKAAKKNKKSAKKSKKRAKKKAKK